MRDELVHMREMGTEFEPTVLSSYCTIDSWPVEGFKHVEGADTVTEFSVATGSANAGVVWFAHELYTAAGQSSHTVV